MRVNAIKKAERQAREYPFFRRYIYTIYKENTNFLRNFGLTLLLFQLYLETKFYIILYCWCY